jgi:hypothetical protein
VVLWHRPGFGLGGGSAEYAGAACGWWPGLGLARGLAWNVEQVVEEAAAGAWAVAGARVLRHGLLLVGVAALALFPWTARVTPPSFPWRAYWLLGIVLVLVVGEQVATDLDNLGRFLFACPLVLASLLAIAGRRRIVWWGVLLWFLAVDVNYVHAFLDGVIAGGSGVEAGAGWWF